VELGRGREGELGRGREGELDRGEGSWEGGRVSLAGGKECRVGAVWRWKIF
jgi:hypothetical protein